MNSPSTSPAQGGLLRLPRRFLDVRRDYIRHPGTSFYGGPAFLRRLYPRFAPLPEGIFSQQGQDLLVLQALGHRLADPAFPKVFVDVGCNVPVTHSNSLFFERFLGFRTVAIDAMEELREPWKQVRPQATFVSCAVGEHNGTTSFEVVEGAGVENMFSSVAGASTKGSELSRHSRSVPLRRLTDVLAELSILDVGILGLDVEGYELPALKGLDFSKVRVHCLVVENNASDGLPREDVRDHMAAAGFELAARIYNFDDIYLNVGR